MSGTEFFHPESLQNNNLFSARSHTRLRRFPFPDVSFLNPHGSVTTVRNKSFFFFMLHHAPPFSLLFEVILPAALSVGWEAALSLIYQDRHFHKSSG